MNGQAVVGVDGFTLTSFDAEAGLDLLFLALGGEYSAQSSVVRGYRGDWTKLDNGDVFFGIGSQKGLPHFMLQSLGGISNKLLDYQPLLKARCTRLDVSIDTDEKPDVGLLENLVLAGGKSSNRITRNNKGGVTFYFGSRQSKRMIRIYDKKAQLRQVYGITSQNLWRYEVELKQEAAEEIYAVVRNTETSPQQKLNRLAGYAQAVFIERRVKFPHILNIEEFNPPIPRKPSGVNLVWLSETVLPYVRKALNEHPKETLLAAEELGLRISYIGYLVTSHGN